MSKNVAIIIGISLLLLIGGLFFINSSKTIAPSPSSEVTGISSEDTDEMSPEEMIEASMSGDTSTSSTSDEADTKEFIVIGSMAESKLKFEPATLTVNKGDKVRIIFKNMGGTHDFVINEFNAKTKMISSGEETTVEFTADKAGVFEYYCSVGNHRQMGMKGTLIVK